LSADTTYEVWTSIVNVTKYHKREDRLRWNIFKLPHHCSYTALGPEKGKDITTPVAEVKWLYEDQCEPSPYIISTSDPIPTGDQDQPPHRQAANFHKGVMAEKDGDFIVTMEHPDTANPKPIEFEIRTEGLTYVPPNSEQKKSQGLAAAVIAARGGSEPPTQRVGFGR
jgi:hypothetical protein